MKQQKTKIGTIRMGKHRLSFPIIDPDRTVAGMDEEILRELERPIETWADVVRMIELIGRYIPIELVRKAMQGKFKDTEAENLNREC